MKALTGYLAAPGFVQDLGTEIGLHSDLKLIHKLENLLVVEGPRKNLCWSQNTWDNLQIKNYKSISEAAELLKNQARFWHHSAGNVIRRGKLIQDKLPKWKIKDLKFLSPAPSIPLGSFMLKSDTELWMSAQCSSPFPDGQMQFSEDKVAPPSRAYLKLWEQFTLSQKYPQKNQLCVDLGSAPGGWTWVLSQLNARVISVDKAKLADNVVKSPLVKHLKQDAFLIQPRDFIQEHGPVDWLCSDIICFPDRLYSLVNSWMDTGQVQNMVMTIKFKGKTDFDVLQKFQQIPNSSVRHLFHNKHELTWTWSQAAH